MTSWTNIFGNTAIKPSQPSYLALTFSANTTLVWPLEAMEGTTVVAAQIDGTATVGGLELLMPPGNTGSNGAQSIITNVGANTFTVTDQAGNPIATVATTQSWLITLTDNTTANGTWRAYQIASTTSSATAASLQGPGLEVTGSDLQTAWVTQYLNVNTLLTTAYRTKAIVWDGASGTLSLDTLGNLGNTWYVAVANEGTGTVTIAPTGGATINGSASLPLPVGASGLIIASASGFNTFGALIGPVSVANGGTGANNANSALTNLGGTATGISIFTAPNAAAVVSTLGIAGTYMPLISGGEIVNPDGINNVTIEPPQANLPLFDLESNMEAFFAPQASGGSTAVRVSNGYFRSRIFAAPSVVINSVWGEIEYVGTGGTAQLTGVRGLATRTAVNAGGATANPDMRAGTFVASDTTGGVSSTTNSLTGVRVTLQANGGDDAFNRTLIDAYIGKANGGGSTASAANGLRFQNTDGVSSLGAAIAIDLPYTVAGIDFRSGSKGASGHPIWLGNNNDIAFDTAGTYQVVFDSTIFSATGGLRVKAGTSGTQFDGNVLLNTNNAFQLANQTDGSAAQTATMTNAPVAGNPAIWVPIMVNGVQRHIAAW